MVSGRQPADMRCNRCFCSVDRSALTRSRHSQFKAAIREVLPEGVWQRCYVYFLRNALEYVPRKIDDDFLPKLRWLYARRDLAEALNDLALAGAVGGQISPAHGLG
jgi:hypothetical protein